jgi:hypothetical protein
MNLVAVDASLRRLQGGPETGGTPSPGRDPLDARVTDNLLAGYARVDALVAGGVDAFAMGNLRHLLELNALVTCGESPVRRAAYAGHLEATERRFYEQAEGGIEDVVEWYVAHQDAPVWERAAGVYARVLSRPQLYIEGNHRTGALVMSYVLLRAGHPPFVLTADSAPAYFGASAALREIHKRGPGALLRVPAITQEIAALLQRCSDRRHLLS